MQLAAYIKPLSKNVRVSSRVTIQNPRPRKYASDAERQKAFRERQAVIQVRVKPETVETFDRIASTLGYTRQEVVYALLMSGLNNNRNWQQTGIPGFRMPRYEDNPMKKKPTPAQLAARERFAEMARSGAFKRGKNPAKKRSVQFAPGPGDKAVYKRYTIVYPTSGNVFYIVRGGVNIGSARSEQEAKNIIDMLSEGESNPTKKTVSQKISQLVHEGYPQRQAVAIALNEERKGKVKRNPLEKHLGGSTYGFIREGTDGYGDKVYKVMIVQKSKTGIPGELATDLIETKSYKTMASAKKFLDSYGRRNNPSEREERKPRVVLITNPKAREAKKQRMLNISWLTPGGAREMKSVPIDFTFTHYVGDVAEKFFVRTENGQLIVSEYATGGRIGQVPYTMRAAALNDRAAAKMYVGEMLSRIGAERFNKAVKSFPAIN